MGKIIFVHWIGNLIRKSKSVCKSFFSSHAPCPQPSSLKLYPLPLGFHAFACINGNNELMYRARDSDSKSPGRLQILHYNIDRFPEIKDLRGLETLLVAR